MSDHRTQPALTRRQFGLIAGATAALPGAAAADQIPLDCLLLPDAEMGKLMADAEERLRDLFPAEGRAAKMQAYRAGPADIRAVFRDPFASQLIAFYAEWLPGDLDFGPKDKHDRVRVTTARLSDLRDQTYAARKFAGGHKNLTEFMIVEGHTDPVVARFEWLASGAERGVAYDALYHVAGRWVLIPKPWRALRG